SCRSGTVPMERSDAAGPSLQIDASASAFAALHPPAGKQTRARETPQETTSSDLAKVANQARPGAARVPLVCRRACPLGAVAAAAGRHPGGHRRGCRGSRSGRSRSGLRLRLAGGLLCLLGGSSRLLLLRGNRLLDLLHFLSLRLRL